MTGAHTTAASVGFSCDTGAVIHTKYEPEPDLSQNRQGLGRHAHGAGASTRMSSARSGADLLLMHFGAKVLTLDDVRRKRAAAKTDL